MQYFQKSGLQFHGFTNRHIGSVLQEEHLHIVSCEDRGGIFHGEVFHLHQLAVLVAGDHHGHAFLKNFQRHRTGVAAPS